MQEDRAYEVSQAGRVQAARSALKDALGPVGDRRLELLEDQAERAAESTTPEDRKNLLGLRRTYIEELNRLWLYAENTGITEKLVRAWLASNRKNLAGVDRTEYSAEATFAMRKAVSLYEARGATLMTYAWKHVQHALSEYRDRALTPVDGAAKGSRSLLPAGTHPDELIDNVTPETVLLAKREMAGAGSL